MASFAEVKNFLSGARGSRADLKQRVAALELRREDLRCLARPREEVIDLVCNRITEVGSTYPALLAENLAAVIHKPITPPPPAIMDDGSHTALPVCVVTMHPGMSASPKSIERALFYLIGDQLKSAVRKAIMEMPYCDAVGPPMAARLKEIENVEAQISGLKAQIKMIEDELTAALRDE